AQDVADVDRVVGALRARLPGGRLLLDRADVHIPVEPGARRRMVAEDDAAGVRQDVAHQHARLARRGELRPVRATGASKSTSPRSIRMCVHTAHMLFATEFMMTM